MNSIRKKPMISAIATAAMLVSGCVSILPEGAPPAARYTMTPVTPTTDGSVVDWSLIVGDPATTRVYDTTGVAMTRGGARIEYFAGAEWADRAPSLYQFGLIQSLENSGRILGVGDRSAIPVGDIVLQTDIRALQAEYIGSTRVVRASVFARLTDGKGTVYAAHLFDNIEDVSRDDVDTVLAAFDRALQAQFGEIVVWVLENGEIATQAK